MYQGLIALAEIGGVIIVACVLGMLIGLPFAVAGERRQKEEESRQPSDD